MKRAGSVHIVPTSFEPKTAENWRKIEIFGTLLSNFCLIVKILSRFPAVLDPQLGHPSANLTDILMGHWGMLWWLFVIQILLGSDVIWPIYCLKIGKNQQKLQLSANGMR